MIKIIMKMKMMMAWGWWCEDDDDGDSGGFGDGHGNGPSLNDGDQHCMITIHIITNSNRLGKPLDKKSAVQTEIRRKGGGVKNPFQMECGSSSVNINHY